MIIKKTVELKKSDYYKTHLGIINNLLPTTLSRKEIEVLAIFLSLPKEIIDDNMFNFLARKKVKETLNLSSAGLSNHIATILKKGFLNKNYKNGKVTPKSFLIPNNNQQEYYFKLINNEI